MYGHHATQSPNEADQFSGTGDGNDAVDSIDDYHFIYEETNENGGGGEAVGDGGSSGSVNQLTLTFRGEVYVFDSVTAEKVQEVLLHLGAHGPSSDTNAAGSAYRNQKVSADYPVRCSHPERAASLNRFRQKRKERCFDRKIRYNVRQEVACRMQRKNGQFASSKGSDSNNSSTAEGSLQEEIPPETSCIHCGTSSKSTPMMRKGPAGPRTLCNACGLFWANKGTLRDISKKFNDNDLAPNQHQTQPWSHNILGTI